MKVLGGFLWGTWQQNTPLQSYYLYISTNKHTIDRFKVATNKKRIYNFTNNKSLDFKLLNKLTE
jgi:hypothetical protein